MEHEETLDCKICETEIDDFETMFYYLSGRAGRSGVNGPVRDRSLRIPGFSRGECQL
jgi:hypothetical protein